jgi:hypothetical protein
MKEILETLTKAAGLFSVTALILSVFHEVGFFYIVGSDFRHLFSTSDYFASVIAWIPESIFYLSVLAFIIFVLTLRSWNFLYRYPKEKLPETVFDKVLYGLLYFTLFSAIVGVFFGPPWLYLRIYPVLAGGVFLVWVNVVSTLLDKIAFKDAVPNWARLLLLLGPVLLVNSFLSGANEAYGAIFRIPDVYRIEQNSPDLQNHVIFLRSFDKGVLVRDPVRSTFDLIKWDRISRISKVSNLRSQPVFCNITGLLCFSQPEP